MRWEGIAVDRPGPGEVLVRNVAIGLNFIDVYHRSGLYPVPLPFTPGMEGAGVVELPGPGVKEFKPGDRVAYSGPIGAYAELLLRPAERLVKLPPGISEKTAAAAMLKGLTAWYLLRKTFKVSRGQAILVHAAAGGVGQLLCQWARKLGAVVIGTVGSDEKAGLAFKAGCREVIVMSREDLVSRVKKITKGAGVPVVYDGIGKATFEGSLDCLAPRGLLVSFGNASGPVPPVDIGLLSRKGSLYLTRPSLQNYTASRADLLAGARELFSAVKNGFLKIRGDQSYPLSEAAKAHRDLEARKTTGSTLLLP